MTEPKRRCGRLAAVAGLVLLGVCVAWTLPLEDAVTALRSWAEANGAIGMAGFGAAYVVLALAFVPGAALTVTAGAAFGPIKGLLVVAIATSVADAAAFLLGRYLARHAVTRLMERYPLFKVVDRMLVEGGWRIVALVRLNPTIPYSASNYLFGVTGVSFLSFLVSSGIFTLPGAFAYLYLGYVGAETLVHNERARMEWLWVGIGVVVTILGLVYVTILARRALQDLASESGSR